MRKIAVVIGLVGLLGLFSCSKENPVSNPQASTIASPALAATPTSSPSKSFTVCQGTFALCTTARCAGSASDQSGIPVPCICDVKQGLSVGAKSCSEVPTGSPTPGEKIASRYFPIQSMAVCEKAAAFAMCLDSPCVVDQNDVTKAKCDCTLTRAKNYVVTAATATDAMCTSVLWSSATVDDLIGVTGFLYSQNPPQLKPFPITIVRVDAGQ